MPLTSITRRGLLGSAAAFAAIGAPALLRAQTIADKDVVIIGAGAAGIAAGRELQKIGKSFVILEARNRVGGRVFTDTSLGVPFEAGALYIHWAERNPWRDAANELGLATIDDATTQRAGWRMYEDGVRVERSRNANRSAFSVLSQELDVDAAGVPDISIIERIAHDGPDIIRAAGRMTRMSLGEEPERISARDYARLWSGDDLIVPEGYGTLVTRYGAGLPVELSTPANVVRWGGSGVEVETARGTIRARSVIVTVPVGVLAIDAIRFEPALPASTQGAIAGLGMGALSKVALLFDRNHFDLPDGTDIFAAEKGGVFNFECFAGGSDVVLAYFGGDHARNVTRDGEKASLANVLESFARIVGPDARKGFVRGAVHAWHNDPLSRGCYSHAKPGQADARARLAEPVGGKLYFAGEATGGETHGGAMTAGGAFLAGRDAARLAAARV